MSNEKPIRSIVIGCGQRGRVYASYALEKPGQMVVVAVCDPKPFRRKQLANLNKNHIVKKEMQFKDWKEVAKKEKFADVVIITTPDQLHKEPAVAFAKLGYHILVEKPMAVNENDCKEIVDAVLKANVLLGVGHVMLYSPYTQKIKEIVQSGKIGKVISIQHLEPVGYFHFAHSYVRGNWHSEKSSTFSLMAKSCHDIDWIRYIMDAKCARVSSFGSLSHFKASEQPAAAEDATKCMQCPIARKCPYSAKTIYLIDGVQSGHVGWPVDVIVDDVPSIENITDALNNGPYGQCVYHADNDVCDQQVVNLEFETGQTATFSMIAFTNDVCLRKSRIFGTLGELECVGETSIKMQIFGEAPELVQFDGAPEGTFLPGHNGADLYLATTFFDAVRSGDGSKILSGPLESLESHEMVFAAERARLTGKVIQML